MLEHPPHSRSDATFVADTGRGDDSTRAGVFAERSWLKGSGDKDRFTPETIHLIGCDDAMFVPSELVKSEPAEAVVDERGSFDMRAEFLKTVTEVTRVVFERAIVQGDVWLAFVQVRQSQKHDLPHYSEMRSRLVEHIDQLLAKSDVELADDYRSFLKNVKGEIEKGEQDGRFIFPPSEKSTTGSSRRYDQHHLDESKEIIVHLFDAMVKRGEVEWAYEHLKRAFVLGLEGYQAMKKRFLELLELELAKGEGQVSREYRQRLQEWRQCLLDECWAQETVVAQ